MLFTPHLLAGAAIGLVFEDWWWIIFLSLLFHLLFDLIPHFDPPYERSKKYYLWSSLDLLIGWLVVMWITNEVFSPSVLLGMLVSIFPDVLTFLVVSLRLRFLYGYVEFHKRIQTDWSLAGGMLMQLGVIAGIIYWRFFIYR